MSLPGYDAWRTGGDYSKDLLVVTCAHCGTETAVTSETEYGASYWTPAECPTCLREYDEHTPWETDNGPEDY